MLLRCPGMLCCVVVLSGLVVSFSFAPSPQGLPRLTSKKWSTRVLAAAAEATPMVAKEIDDEPEPDLRNLKLMAHDFDKGNTGSKKTLVVIVGAFQEEMSKLDNIRDTSSNLTEYHGADVLRFAFENGQGYQQEKAGHFVAEILFGIEESWWWYKGKEEHPGEYSHIVFVGHGLGAIFRDRPL